MTSVVHRSAMFLLLLVVCGPALHPAFAAPGPSCQLLKRLAITNGKYFGEVDGTKMEAINRPVDIPALNLNYPMYGNALQNGELIQEGLLLFYPLDDNNVTFEFYYFKNRSMYRASESDFSAITRDDLLAEPTCISSNMTMSGGVVEGTMHCVEFGYDFIYDMELTCSYQSVSVAPGLPSPEAFESLPPPVYYIKTVQYPLPEVWLEGEVCESSCCA